MTKKLMTTPSGPIRMKHIPVRQMEVGQVVAYVEVLDGRLIITYGIIVDTDDLVPFPDKFVVVDEDGALHHHSTFHQGYRDIPIAEYDDIDPCTKEILRIRFDQVARGMIGTKPVQGWTRDHLEYERKIGSDKDWKVIGT